LSPIADLYKTEVYQLASSLGVVNSILSAKPTDGLFEDGRSDEDQIGASYPELEWAMQYNSKNDTSDLTERQKDVLKIYSTWHHQNKHKVEPIPVCLIPIKLKK
jgi:NAD+ synthase